MSDVEVQSYEIERCGKGRSVGRRCNRRATHVHVRADTYPPLVLWMCRACHEEAVRESDDLKRARAREQGET